LLVDPKVSSPKVYFQNKSSGKEQNWEKKKRKPGTSRYSGKGEGSAPRELERGTRAVRKAGG